MAAVPAAQVAAVLDMNSLAAFEQLLVRAGFGYLDHTAGVRLVTRAIRGVRWVTPTGVITIHPYPGVCAWVLGYMVHTGCHRFEMQK
jgi:hypothetical protein